MLSFDHPNVMSLIGVSFDGEMPLIIMPYMSNGSVLGYVKQNVRKLLLDSEENEEEVCIYIIPSQTLFVQMSRNECGKPMGNVVQNNMLCVCPLIRPITRLGKFALRSASVFVHR